MQFDEQIPVVSCIMPTYNRRSFVPDAIRYFLRQDYPQKELIIIDDGTDPVKDLVPDRPFIHYIRLEKKITLGAKLNLACTYAKGTIIANWDDDDWYAGWRLSYQVSSLIKAGTDVCGINKLLYYDLGNKNAYQYLYPPEQRVWLLGSSLCYTSELWKQNRFAEIDVGMDGLFVWNTAPHRVTVLDDHHFSVHMIHGNNVSPKKTSGSWWHPYPVAEIQHIVGADWRIYGNIHQINPPTIKVQSLQQLTGAITKTGIQPLKNIYACLVHEKGDCVIDLVRNLHYNDPGSIILIYNGGTDKNLLSSAFPFSKYGAVVHPFPRPVKHGYLHQFALDCMQFALDHFSFETFTIVDSDQLCIRKGYSSFLAAYFLTVSNIGMLSSNPERVARNNSKNFVAKQAYNEYELWKPLLTGFADGEDKFVYWTFWPSTVFTVNAVKDLLHLFKKNNQLQHIMQHTKIWATEEVILPTLVKLLGYGIAANPCSYDFVRYQKQVSMEDVGLATCNENAYWVHPIQRDINNPVRKLIRHQSAEYFTENKNNQQQAPGDTFNAQILVDKVRNIKGWLSDKEAALLINISLQLCSLSACFNIVEIGSYHGKSTVIFGTVTATYAPNAKIFAIDTHDGWQGAEDQGLHNYPPSFEILQKNLTSAGIAAQVKVIRDRSYNIKWDLPIAMLFIDGLHDHKNVSMDFGHFSKFIVAGGLVAFHDYADYYPGVKLLVDTLIGSKEYKKIHLVESLIVVQKMQAQ